MHEHFNCVSCVRVSVLPDTYSTYIRILHNIIMLCVRMNIIQGQHNLLVSYLFFLSFDNNLFISSNSNALLNIHRPHESA